MVKAVKTKSATTAEKKTKRTKVSAAVSLNNEFKAAILELKKQFNKQVKEVKRIATAKAVAVASEIIAKHELAKTKAIKDAVNAVEKARQVKAKAEKADKALKMAKAKPAKVTKALKAVKTVKALKSTKALPVKKLKKATKEVKAKAGRKTA